MILYFSYKSLTIHDRNYRVNTFGFVSTFHTPENTLENTLPQLASSYVPLHDLNNGLQDQRAALEFVRDNVAKFGGDPEKVRYCYVWWIGCFSETTSRLRFGVR
jgi:hypothetical protein